MLSASSYDAVVVGGGHNGLVCAAYLARAGLRTARRHLVGGAAVTEEPWPGYRVSTASYVVSLLPQRIVRELNLPRFGYHIYPLDPSTSPPSKTAAQSWSGTTRPRPPRKAAASARQTPTATCATAPRWNSWPS